MILLRHAVRAAMVATVLTGTLTAQRGAPLLKTDLIELLSSPVIPHQEVADLVRRNCLAFRPTERDWSDIRTLGAAPDVVASITGCTTRAIPATPAPAVAAPTPAPATALQVILPRPRIVAVAGSQARIAVLAARGGLPQAGAQLILRGSGAIEGAPGRDIGAVTDDSGYAVFPVRVGRRLATYRFEVVPAAGGTLPGRPMIELVVRTGPPATAAVDTREILFEQGSDSVASIAVVVRDSVGHPVAGEPVVVRGSAPDLGFAPDTAVTDSLGRARLIVARGAMRRHGTLQVQVREKNLASVEVVLGMPLSDGETGFAPLATTSGEAGNGLSEPVVFEARNRAGRPAPGRSVAFRAVNASVTPTTGTTDSAGRVRVEVTLGERVGPAILVATVDSIEKRVTLQVGPGPAVDMVIEHNGFRVNGRWVVVAQDTTFTIRLRASDAFGNVTGLAGLARMLRDSPIDARVPLVRVVSVQEEPASVALVLKAIRPGRATIKFRAVDISASINLEVVQLR